MIYILTKEYSLSKYMFSGLDGAELILTSNRKRLLVLRILRKILLAISFKIKKNCCMFFFSAKIRKKLKKIKENDDLIYIGESVETCFVLSRICKKNQSRHVYFWNPCSSISNFENRIKKIKSYGFNIATFDYEDSKKYNLNYVGQLYRNDVFNQRPSSKYESDFFFCGKDKGRKETLLAIKEILQPLGSCNFIIPENDDFLSYTNYINEMKKGKILLDVVQNGQTGLTIRIMESLFFQKKIITNNKSVLNYDFYNPNNILIFDKSKTNITDVVNFISKPYEKIDDFILDSYKVENVIRRIICQNQ